MSRFNSTFNWDAHFRDASVKIADDLFNEVRDSLGSGGSSPGQPPGRVTGNLQSRTFKRVEHRPGIDIVVVGNDAEYASALEFGTRTMAPRPYLRPALNRLDAIKRLKV